MSNRFKDWFRQAEADMKHARNACETKDYDWSCFAAHQAAEKGLKALFLKLCMEAWGHTLTVLIGNLPDEMKVGKQLIKAAKVLDKHYIPTRYPTGFESGAPVDFYTEEEAHQALKYAEEILVFCRHQISQ